MWKCFFFHFIFKFFLYFKILSCIILLNFFSISKYLYVCTEGKWIRTPIFKMESSFSVSDFRKLNYVTRPNTSSGKIKEEEEENKKYGNTFKNHYSQDNLPCSYSFKLSQSKFNSALKIKFSHRSDVRKKNVTNTMFTSCL